MSAAPHRIGRQVFELSVPDTQAAREVHAVVSRLCSTRLPATLARALDAAAPSERPIRVERLYLDLGRLPAAGLESALLAALGRALGHALDAALADAAADGDADRADLELVARLLATGNLPWWADPRHGDVLEAAIGRALRAAPGALADLLRRALAAGPGARRAALHLRPAALARVVELLAPGHGTATRGVTAALLRGAGTAGRRGLQSQLWEAALQSAAGGTAGRLDLWRETLARVALARGQGARALLAGLAAGATEPAAGLLQQLIAELPPVPAGADRTPETHPDTPERGGHGAPDRHDRVAESGQASDVGRAEGRGPTMRITQGADHLGFVPDSGGESLASLQDHPLGAKPQPRDLPAEAPASRFPLGSPWSAKEQNSGAEAAQRALRGQNPHSPPRSVPDPKRPRPAAATRPASWPMPDAPRVLRVADAGQAGPAAEPISPLAPRDALQITDSGLVILWPFLPAFFARLGLLADQGRAFRGPSAAARAVGLLQFVAAADPRPPEYRLPLDKLLCGLDPESPWPEAQGAAPPGGRAREECAGLLDAVVLNAPILKSMSHDGLRGSFLLRPGVLRTDAAGWLLAVERRSYDVVLDRFPWPVEWVRLPWMAAPLRVDW